MYTKRILIIMFAGLFISKINAQVSKIEAAADSQSLALYNSGQWKALVIFGKNNIQPGTDFSLLRMRIGYAAFMLGNYSESLTQYKKVFDEDPENITALNYVYLNNLYLNNLSAAKYYSAKIANEKQEKEIKTALKISSISTEYSFKTPTDTMRKTAQYSRFGVNVQLSNRLELEQSVAFYNQIINEPNINASVTPPPPNFPPGNSTRIRQLVENTRSISIQQKEYYAKLVYAASGEVTMLGGLHFLQTPFNNVIYNNSIFFAGLKYTTPFAHISLLSSFGKISDSASKQFEGALTLFPLGNTKLYGISKIAYNNNPTFTQIAGVNITKRIWLEANVTLGKYNVLFDNDALYVYNDIDQKELKAGGSVYASLSKNLQLTLNYTFEKKLKYKTVSNHFYQHSITGGLTWKF